MKTSIGLREVDLKRARELAAALYHRREPRSLPDRSTTLRWALAFAHRRLCRCGKDKRHGVAEL